MAPVPPRTSNSWSGRPWCGAPSPGRAPPAEPTWAEPASGNEGARELRVSRSSAREARRRCYREEPPFLLLTCTVELGKPHEPRLLPDKFCALAHLFCERRGKVYFQCSGGKQKERSPTCTPWSPSRGVRSRCKSLPQSRARER
ncbi:hypothetical protein MRX96_043705 [Rhipicephalus microplus]